LIRLLSPPQKANNSGTSELNMDIIIAEDDPVNQKVTRLMLRKLGMNAEAAANGLEVLQALESQHYDIVLMDIQMPKMDGIEATRIIRKRWALGPKIIVITDCDSKTYKKPCLDAGANEFLTKPVIINELKEAIEHCGTAEKLSA
jgi:CheY-like chemotaxis protein